MQKVSDMVKPSDDSEWIKVEDLQDKPRRVTVTNVEWVEVKKFKKNPDDPDEMVSKTLISMEGTDKKYLANITAMIDFSQAYGDDPSSWIGKRIILKPHVWGNGSKGIKGEPADIEVEDGFGSVEQSIKTLQEEFDATPVDDSDIPF